MAKSKGSGKSVGKVGGKTGGKIGGKTVVKKGGLKVISVPVDLQHVEKEMGPRKIGMFVLGLVVVGLVVTIIVVSIPVIKKKYKQMKRRQMLKKWANAIFGNVVEKNASSSEVQKFITKVRSDSTTASSSDWIDAKTGYVDELYDAILSDNYNSKYLSNASAVSSDVSDLQRLGLNYVKEIYDMLLKAKQMYAMNDECAFKKAASELLSIVDQSNLMHLKQRRSAALSIRNTVGEQKFGYYGSFNWPNKDEPNTNDFDYKLC